MTDELTKRRFDIKGFAIRNHKYITLAKRSNHKCWYCQTKLTMKTAEFNLITPLCMGGLDKISNLALSCSICNRAKSDMLVVDFLTWLKKAKNPIDYIVKQTKFTETVGLRYRDDIENGLRKLG